MLRTNLATRPFYNQRAVRVGIGAAAVLVAGLTAGNLGGYALLSRREAALGGDVVQAESRTLDLQRQTRRLRQGLDSVQLDAVTAAARDANALIDRRIFSWTGLLSEFEQTLPDDVRVVSIAPDTDSDGRLVIAIAVVARRAEEVEAFLSALASRGSFTDVITRTERATEDGLLEVTLQARYAGPAPGGAALEPRQER